MRAAPHGRVEAGVAMADHSAAWNPRRRVPSESQSAGVSDFNLQWNGGSQGFPAFTTMRDARLGLIPATDAR